VIGESAQAILAKRQAQAEANRAQMPFTSSIVDDLRAEGFQPTVKFAQENGQTVGKASPAGVVPVLARKDDPQTSKKAAATVEGFRAAQEAKIFNAIFEAGELGATANEIAPRIGLTKEQVNRRLSGMGERRLIYRVLKDNALTADDFIERGRCAIWWKT